MGTDHGRLEKHWSGLYQDLQSDLLTIGDPPKKEVTESLFQEVTYRLQRGHFEGSGIYVNVLDVAGTNHYKILIQC